MKKTIELHQVDNMEPFEDINDFVTESIEEYTVEGKKKFKFIYFLYTEVITFLRVKRVYNPDLEMEKTYFRLGLNAISEVCRLVHFPGQEMEAEIDTSGPFKILVEDLKELDDEWLYSYYLAIIARDKKKLNHILSLPIELIGLGSGTVGADYGKLLVDLRIRFFKDRIFDTSIYQELIEIRDQNADLVKPEPKRGNLIGVYLSHPIIEAMKSLSEEDEKGFNQHLIAALQAHKAFWGQKKPLNPGAPPLCRDEMGFISFPCTALAAMAYDKGWTLEVESGYMPSYMVDGSIMK